MSYSQIGFSSALVVVLLLLVCFSQEAKCVLNKKKLLASFPTLYVHPLGLLGRANFSSIQAAIDHVPSNNRYWIRIYVHAGIYREKIVIPADKPYIYIQGEGKWKTRVIWGDYGSIMNTATLTSLADNTVIKSMTFTNSYNYPPERNLNPIVPALAGMIMGDKTAFYRCAFLGMQDTLWDEQGRHYFKLCTIQGAVDFIFGSGQSIYERCSIMVAAWPLHGVPGYIAAQGRDHPNETNGFIFKDCNIFGTGKTYLGRPWRPYSRVIFYNTSMADIVVPEGWNAWNSKGKEHQLTFAEHECRGPGANKAGRVKWENNFSVGMVQKWTDMTYIDSDGWISNQLFNMLD
ncbi:OLC1v1019246C1 [Oldenlandia corymbosa var. corymbosa]|uniref:Pectinesterase n=1 Tax=Oldenlandia corymbosa var. corymbosa TaxID=529605 RepID=A0AAV1EDK7_OLDCO|nr:OLC1v1019246C1 [Oldenlandia corymbosa var. corymbosa]